MIEDSLADDHESLAASLKSLEAALAQTDLVRAFALLDLFWARLAVHIRAENVCLFPAILNAPAKLFVAENGLPQIDEARAAIARLRGDHNFFTDELAKAVKTMRDLLAEAESENTPCQIEDVQRRVAALAQRLDGHNKLEEEQVYRWPSVLLTPAELARLDDAIRYEIQNLPRRFAEPSLNSPSL